MLIYFSNQNYLQSIKHTCLYKPQINKQTHIRNVIYIEEIL